jgi:hypothetical protein
MMKTQTRPTIEEKRTQAATKTAYVTQYGFYWSMPLKIWVELCKSMAQGGNHNYDNMEGVRALKRRPRVAGKTIHRTLDWQEAEWISALYEEANIMLCPLCYNETAHEESNRCSVCGGCEHCCMGNSFRACEEKADAEKDVEWFCDVTGCLRAWKRGQVTADVAIDRIYTILMPDIRESRKARAFKRSLKVGRG